MIAEIDTYRKDLAKFIEKDEFLMRLSAFASDTNVKLLERPTISYFKKVLKIYDKKIETIKETVTCELERL